MSRKIIFINQTGALTRALAEERHECSRRSFRLEQAHMMLAAQEQEVHDLELRLAA